MKHSVHGKPTSFKILFLIVHWYINNGQSHKSLRTNKFNYQAWRGKGKLHALNYAYYILTRYYFTPIILIRTKISNYRQWNLPILTSVYLGAKGRQRHRETKQL